MNEMQTLGAKSLKHLCAILMTTPKELAELVQNREKYYYVKKKVKLDKRGQPKRDEQGNIIYRELNPSEGGDSDERDHHIPAQADHPFRGKLTRAFRGKLTTPNA